MTTTTGGEVALYLFCLVKAEGFGLALDGTGPGPAERPFARTYGDLVAILSEVPVADFCGPEAERKLADVGWVGERAMRHERIVEQAFRVGPVLPARFGTLFSSSAVLEDFLETNRRMIAGFLDSIRDQEEWALKALLEPATAKRWLGAQMAPAAAGDAAASPGLRYLQQRRAQAAAEKELNRWVAGACDLALRGMREYATDWRQRKVIDDGRADERRQTVLNVAALIRRERLQDLLTRIESINAGRVTQGLSFVLTGPWPPYSFCPPLRAGR
jgi:Gas vesicle synthesis protein GvpL/GvpF